jgi:hypothetical protein
LTLLGARHAVQRRRKQKKKSKNKKKKRRKKSSHKNPVAAQHHVNVMVGAREMGEAVSAALPTPMGSEASTEFSQPASV